VIKTLLAQVLEKIPQDMLPRRDARKRRGAEMLPVVLVFGTVEDGLRKAQPLLNAEGKKRTRRREKSPTSLSMR